MKVPVLFGLLLMVLHDCSSLTAREKRQVNREIEKQIMALEEKLMGSDTCPIKSCASAFYKSCQEALEGGNVFSTQYMIQPDEGPPFLVYCDMDPANGTGWVVFQRRFDGSVDFYRNWTDYQQGFGDIHGEFWLGLDKIHRLTNEMEPNKTRLRVELENYDGSKAFADYSAFSVGPEESSYELYVSNDSYPGTAGDSILKHHNMMKFSTPDVDNDQWSVINCAVVSHGAWWYNRCHESNLNGKFSATPMYGTSYVRWFSWKLTQSLKGTTMKLA